MDDANGHVKCGPKAVQLGLGGRAVIESLGHSTVGQSVDGVGGGGADAMV